MTRKDIWRTENDILGRKWVDRVSGVAVTKAAKGSVQVEVDKGFLRLRWRWRGRRFAMALGLPDDRVNRAIALRRVAVIEADIKAEQFDETLAKYRDVAPKQEDTTVVELYRKYVEYKSRQVEAQTLQKYESFATHLQEYFKKRAIASIQEEDAFRFRDWLLKRNAPITVRERIGWLKSCWDWGAKRKLITGANPWIEVLVKVPTKQKHPFTPEEVKKILVAFETPELSHFRDYAEFLLAIGCRPGEAVGLRWRHLKPDCSGIWIGESLGRERQQKPTKTNKERAFDLTPRLQAMLLARRPTPCDMDALVFTSVEGHQIDDKNFNKRYWKKALAIAEVPYRRPYNSRHSFVSNAYHQGLDIVEISDITGHEPATLVKSYLGSVVAKKKLPTLYEVQQQAPEEATD